jgi:N-acetylneuraminate synthase
VYGAAELDRPRESPFGTTNGELKRALELGKDQYEEIDAHCKNAGITWFASPWDEASVDFLEDFDVPCHKVASASLTDDRLLRHIRAAGKPVILSTGMSTMAQIDHAVEVLGQQDLILLHATSTYPASYDELNLKVIPALAMRFNVPIGYSGHETGIASSVASVALGATMVERHLTLDRAMWGSDQAASLEPNGMQRLVRDIRLVETSFGDGIKRLLDREVPIMEKLRRVGL